MNFIIWIIIGTMVGWVATSLLGRRDGLLMNIIVGIVGAFLAGIVLSPYLGVSLINQNNFSLPALLVSLGGAIILLFAVSLFQSRRFYHR